MIHHRDQRTESEFSKPQTVSIIYFNELSIKTIILMMKLCIKFVSVINLYFAN